MLKKILISILLLSPTFAFADLTTSIEAYYPLYSNGDDSTSNHYNGTTLFITYDNSSPLGNGAIFDTSGSNAYIAAGYHSYNSGDLTSCMWIYPNVVAGTVGFAFSDYNYLGQYSNATWKIYNPSSQQDLYYTTSDGTEHSKLVAVLTRNVWQYVCTRYDASAVTVEGFVNGSSTGLMTGAGNVGIGTDGEITLGRAGNYTGGYYFNGKEADVSFWSRKLTNSEITQLYNTGSGLAYPFTGGGGGGGGGGGDGTSTISGGYTLSSGLGIDGAFNLGSTTLSFSSIDFSACDVSSINLNPFASSSLSWGTVNVPSCFLQSFKFLLFGLNGFDDYDITHFVNNSSSTLPFIFFKFISSGLVYINPINGELINLSTSTSAFTQAVPFPILGHATDTIQVNFMASSSLISGFVAPSGLDNTLATLELVFFFITWGLVFKQINV